MQLSSEEEGEVSETGKGEGRVAGGEASPSIMERVVRSLGADVDGDERVGGCAFRGLATGDKVRAWTTDGVFDNVGDEGCKDDTSFSLVTASFWESEQPYLMKNPNSATWKV